MRVGQHFTINTRFPLSQDGYLQMITMYIRSTIGKSVDQVTISMQECRCVYSYFMHFIKSSSISTFVLILLSSKKDYFTQVSFLFLSLLKESNVRINCNKETIAKGCLKQKCLRFFRKENITYFLLFYCKLVKQKFH